MYCFFACQDHWKAKGGHHNASSEEVRQLPAGVAGGVGVLAQPLGDECGDGAQHVEEQHKQWPVHPGNKRKTESESLLLHHILQEHKSAILRLGSSTATYHQQRKIKSIKISTNINM